MTCFCAEILEFLWRFPIFFLTLPLTKPVLEDRAGQIFVELLRPTMPFVGQAEGKGRFLNVTVCTFKLRNFGFSHSGNATVSACVGGLYPSGIAIYYGVAATILHIILLGVGWLRCLSLGRGNAKA